MSGNDAYTVLLLHLDGANGSTSFPDASASNHSFTANGSAQISTAQSKFGGASLSLPGSSWINTADSADWAFGTLNWTYDFFMKRAAVSGAQENMFGQGNSGLTGGYHYGGLTAANAFRFAMNDDTYLVTAGTVADTSQHHIAIVRDGNSLMAALDGTFGTSVDITGIAYTDSPGAFSIGRVGDYAAASTFNGYIDEFRISKGIARWTSNFTPPTAAYDNGQLAQPYQPWAQLAPLMAQFKAFSGWRKRGRLWLPVEKWASPMPEFAR